MSSASAEDRGMEMLERGEVWDEKASGLIFVHTKVVFTNGPNTYYAITERCFDIDEEIPLADLQKDAILIPTEEICPVFPEGLTRAPDPLPKDCYVKRPSLLNYDTGSTILRKLVLQEARICEVLARRPHPNVAKYIGCKVEGDRISGLCFAKYDKTLEERKCDLELLTHYERWHNGIKQGIKHLHRLGYVHNDVNPTNIMFAAADNTPVLIDFDSCRREGARLGIKRGTYGWSEDGGFLTCVRRNDFYGLGKIREFLDEWKCKGEIVRKEEGRGKTGKARGA